MTRRADPELPKRDRAVREVLRAAQGAEMPVWRIAMNARIQHQVEMTVKQAAAAAIRIGARYVREGVWVMESTEQTA